MELYLRRLKALFQLNFCIIALSYIGLAHGVDQKNQIEPNRIIFLMQTGHISQAVDLYRQYSKQIGYHDYEIIQKMGLIILDQGFRSKDLEYQLLTLYGAGISLNEKALYILEEGLRSSVPELQLVAINFLARFQDDHADEILNRALYSDSLLIRLEGAYYLAERGISTAYGQTESLMNKVDKSLWFVFPQIFAMIGNSNATKALRKLMTNSNEQVRIAAILSAAEHHRDDLLLNIRTLSSHHNLLQQEACAKALGLMKDETSIPRLETFSKSGSITVKLAALQALYRLGKHEVKKDIEEIARTRNLFAIQVLNEISGSEDLLAELSRDSDLQVRVNATIALLKRKDPRCVASLSEVLIRNRRDLAFLTQLSPGKALDSYKVVPSAGQNLTQDDSSYEISLNLREEILSISQHLPEKAFLQLAQTIFNYQQNDLIPKLVALLENLQTSEAIELLKINQQKAGAPLIRNYCALALYRLKEPGPYKEVLNNWVKLQLTEELIQIGPIIPWTGISEPFKITPKEKSRLLIEAFEAFSDNQEEMGINILLDAIQFGNLKNKFVLAGLLIRLS